MFKDPCWPINFLALEVSSCVKNTEKVQGKKHLVSFDKILCPYVWKKQMRKYKAHLTTSIIASCRELRKHVKAYLLGLGFLLLPRIVKNNTGKRKETAIKKQRSPLASCNRHNYKHASRQRRRYGAKSREKIRPEPVKVTSFTPLGIGRNVVRSVQKSCY